MIKHSRDSKLNELSLAINRLLIALGVVAIIALLLAASVMKLSGKRERVVIVPPNISEPFYLANSYVSEAYLRQMADYYTRLIYNVTPKSVDTQIETLLNHVDSGRYHELRSQLTRKAEEIKSKNLATAFFPTRFDVDEKTMNVYVEGDFAMILGREKQRLERKQFLLIFDYKDGRIWLKQIREVNENV